MPPLAAAMVVFGASAAILVLEILAGRLLAPYVGVTLETYTGIIGTVLAGISVGTWLGGRAADTFDPRRLLGPLLIAGGISALLAVPLTALVASVRPGSGPVAIVFLAALGFFAPAAILSAVNPAVAKAQLHDLARTGGVVGRISAIATAGAIFGTFVTGFVLVSAIPSRSIVIGLAIVLMAGGVLLWATLGRGRGATTPLLALALLAGGTGWAAASPQPCQRESAYFCIRVEVSGARPTGRTLYLDTLRHSYVDLADPSHLEFSYTQVVSDVMAAIEPAAAPLRALHIGGGGFTLPRYLAATRPGSTSLVLELDPEVLAVARDELGLVTSEELEVRLGDARLGVANETSDSYDLVVGDAFGGLAVPWDLTTREMVEEVKRVLHPTGIYVLNVIDYPPLGFARAETATLRAVFPHLAVIAPPARIARRDGGNIILIASETPLPLTSILDNNRSRLDDDLVIGDQFGLDDFIGDALVLTDDFAPVDQLLTPYR